MKIFKSTIKPLLVILLSFISIHCFAQDPTDDNPLDPGAIAVSTVQHMNFGSFSVGGSAGSVIISPSGTRLTTGSVFPLNGKPYFQAIFEVEAPVGTIISLLNGPDATLTGSNGGTMSLHLNSSEPASPFSSTVTPPSRTAVNIGGTLSITNSLTTAAGTYSGTFYIIFNQE